MNVVTIYLAASYWLLAVGPELDDKVRLQSAAMFEGIDTAATGLNANS